MPDERSPIDLHLERFDGVQLATLEVLRDTLRELLPAAEECLKYRMPCFAVRGKAVAGFDGFKQHNSYFPHSGNVIENVRGVPSWCSPSQGTLQFPLDRPLPVGLVRKLVRTRLDEISDVTDGKRLEFYDDGTVKAEGSMKAGKLNGAWRWYRTDGSLMRTGRFRGGEQVGTWETWDREGALVKKTTYGR
jgi:uncharacterized protein YdhG (YjbR/CyaY superfamily)